MAAKSVQIRRQRQVVVLAVCLSLLAHAGLIVLLVREWHAPALQMHNDVVEMALERPRRSPPQPRDEKQRLLPAAPAPSSRPAEAEASPPLPVGPGGTVAGAGTSGNGQGASGEQALAAPGSINNPCIGRDRERMSPPRRRACDMELLALGAPPQQRQVMGISPEAKAAFDKGKEMRNCMVAHPQGGCLSEKGFTFIQKF